MLTAGDTRCKVASKQMAGFGLDFFRHRQKRYFAPIANGTLEEYFAAHDFNRVPSDAHVNYPVIAELAIERCADKNPAGPLHLDTLLDEDAFIGFSPTPCATIQAAVQPAAEAGCRSSPL